MTSLNPEISHIQWVKLLERALEASNSSIVITDAQQPNNPIIYVNPGFEALTGYSADEVLGHNCRFLQGTDRDQPEIAKIRTAVEEGRNCEVVVRNYKKNGRLFWNEVNLSPVYDDTGKLTNFIAIQHDVSERKEAEEALQESQNRFQAFMDHSPAPAWISDENGVMLYISKPYTTLFGFSPEEIVGKTIAEVYPPDIAEAYLTNIQTVIHTGKAIEALEPFTYISGAPGWALSYKFPLYEKSGRVLVGGVAVDITARLQAEEALRRSTEELRQAQKMEAVGRLAGGVAHDFNNILTAILGYSELILANLAPDSPLAADINEIKKGTERAAAVTRQLLAFSRKQIAEPELVNLNEIVLGMAKLLRRLIGEDIELVTKLADGLGTVRANPSQLEQVILNLAINARDAMPDGGKLFTETSNIELDADYCSLHAEAKPGSHVLLTVTDTGIGMDATIKEHIFEPFFTTKDSARGTGLGLATVYGIVTQIGGHIRVYSEVGLGTTFQIYLPCVSEAAEQTGQPALNDESWHGTETILLVEDEEAVRRLSHRILTEHGYHVLVASEPGQALAICRDYHAPIDLIVSDVIMPGGNGADLVKQLRELRPNMHVMYMSGYTDGLVLHYGLLDTNAILLHKPFKPSNLLAKVRQVLDSTE